jgi:hypothetical protein
MSSRGNCYDNAVIPIPTTMQHEVANASELRFPASRVREIDGSANGRRERRDWVVSVLTGKRSGGKARDLYGYPSAIRPREDEREARLHAIAPPAHDAG